MLGAYLLVNGILSLIVASFFDKKKIGSAGVFIISFLFTPLIGILIGIVSETKPEFTGTKNYSKPRGINPLPEERLKEAKATLIREIEPYKKEEELGLLSDNARAKLESLREEYKSLDIQTFRTLYRKQNEAIVARGKKKARTLLSNTLVAVFIIAIIVLWYQGFFDDIKFNMPSFDL
jgi:hypothetical protein